jgi:hypothetical protein
MTKMRFSLAAAATVVLSTTFLSAQSAPANTTPAPAEQTAKPSPYQGVSVPPASDVISTTEQAPPASVTTPAPATRPLPAPAPAPAVSSNPDAGIIETPLPPSADENTPHSSARVHVSSYDTSKDNTDEGIVTYVPGPANALPEGTVFRVSMLQDIDAYSTTPNTPFSGRVTQDITRNGKVVVPVGSELRGRVVYATSASRLHGGSTLHLRADEFVLPDGTRYHLHAQVIDTQGSNTTAKGEGNIVPSSEVKRNLAVLGAGAGGGAIVGAAIGGGVGAIVGTAIGAGAATTHWLLVNRSANLPASSLVIFSLTDPMLLNPMQDQKTELLPQSF